MRIFLIMSFLFFAANRSTAQSAPAKAEAKATDYRFIAAKFAIALIIDPNRLDKSATAAQLPIDQLWKSIDAQTAVDAKKLERAILLAEFFPGGNVAFFPAAAIRYSGAVDGQKQLTTILGGDVKKAQASGKEYWMSSKLKMAKVEISGYVQPDGQLLIAPWPTIDKMLAAKEEKRLLAEALRKANLDHEIVLICTPKVILQSLPQPLDPKTDNPQLVKAEAVAKRLELITIAIDLGRQSMIRAEFRTENAEGAKFVEEALKEWMEWGKKMYTPAREELEKQLPEDLRKPFLAILDEVVTGYQLSTKDNTVLLTVSRPRGLDKK